jgi:hypothetical protein
VNCDCVAFPRIVDAIPRRKDFHDDVPSLWSSEFHRREMRRGMESSPLPFSLVRYFPPDTRREVLQAPEKQCGSG